MHGILPNHKAWALAPSIVSAADGDAPFRSDDDLNRVVRMSRHDALGSGREEEAALPQVPARHVQPAIRRVVGCEGQASILATGPGALRS